ncbi:MAG: hypothetical protein H7062_22820 [Candidatus Saccharimonas sp.]|nr:hypothetical protein [Planctomycetaceae bacterium]
MSGTLVDSPPVADEPHEQRPSNGPDLSVLEDHTPVYLRASRALAGLTLAVGLVFLFFCFRPLWHTDVWGHLAYGRVIWQTQSLPATEPLMPLAQGMRFVDTAWLSQLIGYGAIRRWGVPGLQGLYALSVTICAGLLAWRAYRTSRNGWFGFLAVLVFLTVAWSQLIVMRPQLAGLVCFVTLLSLCTSRKPRAADWFLVPTLFAAWANLHGSFLIGLALLGCCVVGRAVDVVRRTGSLRSVVRDDRTRRNFLLLELAAVAVLLNPYGIGLYAEALQISSNANLQELTEWAPLSLREGQGQLFAAVAVLLAMLYRWSPRRVRTWEVLALVGFGGAALWSSRLLIWWTPVAALLVATHGYAAWRSSRRLPLVGGPSPRAGKWSVVTVGLIWICFAYSPLGVKVMHGKNPELKKAVSTYTPVVAVEYLKKNPPQGLVFNIYEWGDFLQWNGPPGMKVFVNSHAHLVPRDVWQAYMLIIEQRGEWEEGLDRYGVNTVVLDAEFREQLIKSLKENEKWKVGFEQDGQVVFLRKQPI